MTADEKLSVARSIYDLALNRYGLRPSDLFFDMLTFTIGSGDSTLRNRITSYNVCYTKLLRGPEHFAGTPISFPDWKLIGAEAVVIGKAEVEGDRVTVEMRLYDSTLGNT